VHWRTSRKWTRDTREQAGWLGKRLPRFAWVGVEVWPVQARGRLADVGAHMPTVKAAIDGLCDCDCLPGDSPEFVRSLMFRAPARGVDGVRLVLVGEPRK